MIAAAARELPWRKWLRLVHLWVGLTLCLPLALIGVTGTILVYEDEINELFDPPPKRVASGGTMRPVNEIVEAGRAVVAPGSEVLGFAAPSDPSDPVMIRFVPADFRPPGMVGTVVYVDPATLAILGKRELAGGVNLMREIFLLHANLSSGRDGRDIVGWLGVAMLVLGVSGLVLWWPRNGRWRMALFMKRGATGYRFHRDLHAVVGFWGLLVFLIVSFTGVYVCFPQTTGEIVRYFAPGRDLRAATQALRVEPAPGMKPIGLAEAYAIARAEAGDLPLRSINVPRRPNQPMTVGFNVYGQASGSPGHGPPQLNVYLDPYRGKVLEVRDPRQYTTGETILAWQMPVHAGHGTGWLWRLLVALSGFMPVVFSITGPMMWWLERRAKRAATNGLPRGVRAIESELQ